MTDPTPAAQVRFLVNDPKTGDGDPVFSDDEIAAYLAMESDNVKRAAAQAIDTIADNEALTLKYIQDHQLTLDGSKVAAALRVRAASLRDQAVYDLAQSDDGAFFEFIPSISPWCP